jgi:hypothetical protein
MRLAAAWILIAVLGVSSAAFAQESADDESAAATSESSAAADSDAAPEAAGDKAAVSGEAGATPTTPPSWWFGAYVQTAIIPSFMLNLFLGAAPTVADFGFGVTATHRDKDGFSLVMGLGYESYAFNGPFRIQGDPEEDTEYLNSSLGLLHLRGQMMWSTDIVPNTLSFEYGFGLDIGVVLGQLVRSEAYRIPPGSGDFHKCSGPLNPAALAPSGQPYCELPQNLGSGTDAYNQHGAQYNVVEKRVPPIALIPMLPALSLRYTPVREVALKFDFAFGLMQFAFGLSAAYGVDL